MSLEYFTFAATVEFGVFYFCSLQLRLEYFTSAATDDLAYFILAYLREMPT